MKHSVLVFPCGSECGLEIRRSLDGLKEIELFGGSSVDDHGKFVFENYIGDIPYVNDENFIIQLNEIAQKHKIQYIYPAMDSVVDVLANNQHRLNAKVVGSCAKTTTIASSKAKTYRALRQFVRCPRVYTLEELQIEDLPVFLKPEVGCGSQGVLLAKTMLEIDFALKNDPSLMILENLPGEEYTIDCFTDASGNLLYSGPRKRRRISKGISVNTTSCADPNGKFEIFARSINEVLKFRGAWFFQVKHAADGELALLEIAPRVAGSMGLQRCKGVNLPLLSVLDLAGAAVTIKPNDFQVEFDRALYNRVKLSKEFSTLYLDFDDCFIINDELINTDLLKLIGQFRNSKRPVVMISRHRGDLAARLKHLGVTGLFDEIIHLVSDESKALHLKDPDGLLIDDSFSERLSALKLGVSALGPESVEALIE